MHATIISDQLAAAAAAAAAAADDQASDRSETDSGKENDDGWSSSSKPPNLTEPLHIDVNAANAAAGIVSMGAVGGAGDAGGIVKKGKGKGDRKGRTKLQPVEQQSSRGEKIKIGVDKSLLSPPTPYAAIASVGRW